MPTTQLMQEESLLTTQGETVSDRYHTKKLFPALAKEVVNASESYSIHHCGIFILITQLLLKEEKIEKLKRHKQRLDVAKDLLNRSDNDQIKVFPPEPDMVLRFAEFILRNAEYVTTFSEIIDSTVRRYAVHLMDNLATLNYLHYSNRSNNSGWLKAMRAFDISLIRFTRCFLENKLGKLQN